MTKADMVVSKTFSARFLCTVLFTCTACLLAWKGTFPMEAFAALVTLVVNSYFIRNDREANKEVKPDASPKPEPPGV